MRRAPVPYPGYAVPLGLALAALGGLAVALALQADSPAAIAAAAGALVLILPGLWLAMDAGSFHLRRLRAARAGTPWGRDRRWSRERVRDDRGSRAPGVLAVGLFLVAFLTPLHLALADAGSGGLPGALAWAPWIGLGLFDLAALGVLANGLWLLARRARHGRPELELHGFPFRPGGAVEVTFSGGPSLRGAEELRAELNLVEEAYLRSASEGRSTPVWRSLHDESRSLRLDERGRARLSFELPAGAPGNDLWAEPPRYWELEVAGRAPAGDYRGLFMLPVYRDRAAGPVATPPAGRPAAGSG